MEQNLSEDYWEGYYAMRSGDLIRCTDSSTGNIDYCVYDLRKGTRKDEGRFAYDENSLFSDFAREVAKSTRSDIFLRVSDQAENPDRHD